MNKRTFSLLAAAATFAALSVTGWWWASAPVEDSPPGYSLFKVRRGEITAVVAATGTLNPVNTVQVGSQVSGTIQSLNADFNSQVAKGEVIAQIEPALFRAELAEAEANLSSAEAGAKQAWVSVLETKRELDRQTRLFKQKLVAQNILDQASYAYDSARVAHQLKQASVAQATAVRERKQLNLDYTTIYAPIDGVVISRDVEVGQTVAASLQAPTLFTIANDLVDMQVEAEVDEAYIGEVREGQPVRFSVFAYPERTFSGRVSQVRLQPKVESGVVKYTCIIHVNNADQALKPGMTATVSIEVARQADALQLPGSALRFVPDWPQPRLDALRRELQPGQQYVWTPDGEGLRPIKVSAGIVGERLLEVRGEGLTEGMAVALPEKRGKTDQKRRFGLSLF